MIRIKNCGLKTPQAVACAAISGASYIGFVHHLKSPRHLTPAEIQELFQHVPPEVATVIVLVDPSDDMLFSLPTPDFWQIHGANAQRIEDITNMTGIPVIAAISVESAEDLADLAELEHVSAHLLFDAKNPGSGRKFEWEFLKNLKLNKPWFLAGGLTPGNVAEAIRLTDAPMVDVSSGIEESPGVKSLEKIASFNAAVLNA